MKKERYNHKQKISSSINYLEKNPPSKSSTLKFLKKTLKKSKIEKIYDFTVFDWNKNQKTIIKNIQKKFSKQKIIIRSSALDEDSIKKSHAGNYESILNIDTNSISKIKNGINRVKKSYIKKGNNNPNNLILIQTQSQNIQFSGVVFTRSPDSGSPYFIINYEESGSTVGVTKGLINNSIKIARNTNLSTLPKHWSSLLKSIFEIENIFNSTSLDIEFGVTNSKKIIIFQVRPITSLKQKLYSDSQIFQTIKNYKNIFKKKKRDFNMKNEALIFSDMTDWNPAEIIGNNPNLLDYSLYDYLIMSNAWYLGRKKLNYSDVHGKKLMIKFGNKPYVDIRSSFLSLIPKNIPKKLKQKLLFFYYKKLQQNTHLHDKAEFEILFTCYEPYIENRLSELSKYGFTDDEILKLEKSLLEFTNSIINNFNNLSQECYTSIKKMKTNRKKILSNLSKKESTYKELLQSSELLLEDCKNLGTIPFSMMARLSFISSSILKSLIKNNQVSEKSAELFMNSIDTPLSQFQKDQLKLRNNTLSKKLFLKKYGHLRPGTYDITATRYDKNPLLLSGIKINSKKFKTKIPKFRNINKIFDESGLDFSKIDFEIFLKKSLSQREELKFEFTKNLSDALELIAIASKKLNFSRDEISNLDISDILFKNKKLTKDNLIKKWTRSIKNQKTKQQISNHLSLSPIISSEQDFSLVTYPYSKPNFVTTKNIKAELIYVKNVINASNMSKKIVLLENADPGYDWIFSYELSGLITKYGGVASHMSIRCSELNLPAAIGCGELLFNKLMFSSKIQLDCDNSQIIILEHSKPDKYIEEKQVLKSLGYIK